MTVYYYDRPMLWGESGNIKIINSPGPIFKPLGFKATFEDVKSSNKKICEITTIENFGEYSAIVLSTVSPGKATV